MTHTPLVRRARTEASSAPELDPSPPKAAPAGLDHGDYDEAVAHIEKWVLALSPDEVDLACAWAESVDVTHLATSTWHVQAALTPAWSGRLNALRRRTRERLWNLPHATPHPMACSRLGQVAAAAVTAAFAPEALSDLRRELNEPFEHTQRLIAAAHDLPPLGRAALLHLAPGGSGRPEDLASLVRTASAA